MGPKIESCWLYENLQIEALMPEDTLTSLQTRFIRSGLSDQNISQWIGPLKAFLLNSCYRLSLKAVSTERSFQPLTLVNDGSTYVLMRHQ